MNIQPQPEKGTIKNLVFDMGGVLVDLDREACIRAFREIGYPEAADLLDPYRQSGIFLQLEEGKVSPEQLHDYIRDKTGRAIDSRAIDNALERFVTGLPLYKLEMLRNLRHSFRVYLLSNTNAIMMPGIRTRYFTQEGLRMEDYFDGIFLSYEMQLAKPTPAIFEKMLREGGFQAEESLFVDDSPANIETARKLGFYTYLARPGEDFRPIFNDL